jgi:hypothetical protein
MLAYLSRYTHRVAISNSRLIDATSTSVTFKWKDYPRQRVSPVQGDDARHRQIHPPLPDPCPARRFPPHPALSFFANSGRAENIARARQLLDVPASHNEPSDADGLGDSETQTLSHPCCGGRMIIVETFERGCAPRYRPTVPSRIDSS